MILGCVVTPVEPVRAQTQGELAVMPLPARAVQGQGQFLVDGKFGIKLEGYTEPRLLRAQQRFVDTLSRETGIPLWHEAKLNQPSLVVRTAGPSARVQQLREDESYHLEISPSHV
ncbi:MAG: beta-N-acetylhexosaminidase, partial [Acidobacteriaceae bacterium]